MPETIEEFNKEIKRANNEWIQLLVELTKYVNTQPTNKKEELTKAIAVKHFTTSLNEVEDAIAEFKREIEKIEAKIKTPDLEQAQKDDKIKYHLYDARLDATAAEQKRISEANEAEKGKRSNNFIKRHKFDLNS